MKADFLRTHGAFLVLWALAAAGILHFTASDVIASVGDDSISYLMLARFMADPGDAVIREWVGYQAHFPPLLPLALALTGGAWNFAIAHAVVAGFAILSLVLLYRWAALQLGGPLAGALGVALFLLMPTAWVSLRGILSEAPFLFFTLWALWYHEARLRDGDAPPRRWIFFGVLLGAALLTRTAGFMLVLAYAVQIACGAIPKAGRRGLARRLLPFLPLALMVAAWLAWRPPPEGYNYRSVIGTITFFLASEPGAFLRRCAQFVFGGWVRSFAADSGIHWLVKGAFGVVGALGVAGAVLRARANRMDGWYVLVTLAVIFVWLFPEDNTRRLLYPIVPLLLVQAGVFVAFAARAIPSERQRRVLALALAAGLALLCLPAWLTVQGRSFDRERILPDFRYRYSDITDYYTTLSRDRARAGAVSHAKLLAGLESLEVVTPPGAKVMWGRPDYVAVVGHRQGVAWSNRWEPAEFVRRIERAKVDYLVLSTQVKSDMQGAAPNPDARFEWALAISEVVYSDPDATRTGYDMLVLRIDPARLAGAAR